MECALGTKWVVATGDDGQGSQKSTCYCTGYMRAVTNLENDVCGLQRVLHLSDCRGTLAEAKCCRFECLANAHLKELQIGTATNRSKCQYRDVGSFSSLQKNVQSFAPWWPGWQG